MTAFSYYARQGFAIVAAVALSATLMLGSFSADPQIRSAATAVLA